MLRKFFFTAVFVSFQFHPFLNHFLLHAAEEEEPLDLADWVNDQDIQNAKDSGDISAELAQQLQDLYDNPVNVNDANAGQIAVLPGIELDEAQRIVDEREKNGKYKSALDLIERNEMPRTDYEKVKLFVRTEIFSVFKNIKIKGEIQQDSSIKPEQSNKTTADLVDKAYSPTTDKTRLKLSDLNHEFFAGVSFIGDNYVIPDGLYGSTLTVRDARQYRWIKGYAGYDSNESAKNGKIPGFMKQFYAGNYRMGFFEGTTKEKYPGFIPDDQTNVPGKIGFIPEDRKESSLRGFAGKIGTNKLNYSGFYSRDTYPASFQTQKQDPITGKITVSSKTVNDLLDIETVGGFLGYSPHPVMQIGTFWNKTRAKLSAFNFDSEQMDSNFWGLYYRGNVKGINYRTVFSRSDKPTAGNENRNFYFGRIHAKPVKGSTEFSFCFKRTEPGYVNPVGQLFADKNIWEYSSKIIQEIGKNAEIRFDFSQGKKTIKGYLFSTKEISAQVRYKASEKVVFQLQEVYQDPKSFSVSRTLNPDGTIKSFSVSGSNGLKSTARMVHRPSSFIENRFDLGLTTNKRDDPGKFQVGNNIGYRLLYRLSGDLQLLGELKYSDTDLYSPNTENQTSSIELWSKAGRNVDFRIRWQNVHQTKSQTVIDENGIEYDIANPGFQNTVTLRVIYKW